MLDHLPAVASTAPDAASPTAIRALAGSLLAGAIFWMVMLAVLLQ